MNRADSNRLNWCQVFPFFWSECTLIARKGLRSSITYSTSGIDFCGRNVRRDEYDLSLGWAICPLYWVFQSSLRAADAFFLCHN